MVDLQDRIVSLPGDLFSIKSVYLGTLQSIASSDINSAVVLLGKAGERLAKGSLRHFGVQHEENASFDVLLRHLSAVSPSPVLVVGLRTVLKYRNQAAHDTMTEIGIYDLDAALSSFCAAYQAVYGIMGDESQEPPDSRRKSQSVQPAAASPGTLFLSAHLNKLSLLTSLILLLAIVRGGSYDFFLVVRIVVTVNSALLAWRYYKKRTLLTLLFGGVAVLFNPVLPVFFSREVWRLIDAVVLGLLLWSVFRGRDQ
jgi:hypothetical protein